MTALLSLKGVSLRYGPRPALVGIGLQLEPGERVALVGPNGAGKSSLLKLLAGLRPDFAGEVVLSGDSLRSLSRLEVARRVSLVPQEPPAERGLTVGELVLTGLAPRVGAWSDGGAEGRARAFAALVETGLQGLAGRPLHALSGGELRRALIARALLRDPALLLMDEPLASLDLGAQGTVLGLARAAAARGVGVIVALHDLNLALREFPRLLLMVRGALVADGAPREVLTPERVEAAFGPATFGEAGPLFFPRVRG